MAAGNTYIPIATTTLSSTATSFTFSSISGSYTDLVMVSNFGTTSGNPVLTLGINGDTGTNYSFTYIRGDAGGAVSYALGGRSNTTNILAFSNYGASSNYANTLIMNFQNYSNSTTYKTTIYRYGAAEKEVGAGVTLWRSTSAITSFTVDVGPGTFTSGSTFTLYGIAAA